MSHAPICDNCGIQMKLKTSKDGHQFYGCPNWPKCDETASTEDDDFGS